MRLNLTAFVIAVCLIVAIDRSVAAETSPADEKAPKALPVLVLGLTSNTLTVQWEELQAGRAGFSLYNISPDNTPRKIALDITELSLPGQAIPLTLDREKTVTLDPFKLQRFKLVIPNNQKFKLQPGTYSAVLTLQDRDGKFATLNVPVQVTIPGIQPAVAKATLIAVRNIPFTTCWRGSLIVPLRFPSAASELPDTELKQGFIRKETGGLATVSWSEIGQQNGASCCAKLAVDSLPSAGRYEGEVNFGGAQDKNSTLALSVIAKDCVVWPILITALGILLAWIVNRYVGVLRITWTLRKQEAELGQAFGESQAKFENQAKGRSFEGYSIDEDVRKKRETLRTQLSNLEQKWTTSLQGDSDYLNAVAALQSLQTAIAQWAQFAPALKLLEDALNQAKSEVDPGLVLPRAVTEPALFSIVQGLLQGSPLSIADLATKLQDIHDKLVTLETWRESNREAKAATSSLRDVRREQLDLNQTSLANQAEQHLVTSWQHLWGDDAEALKSVSSAGGDLDNAKAELAQITAELQGAPHVYGVAAFFRVPASLLEGLVVPTAVSTLPASDTQRAQLLHQSISLGDTASTLFAFVIALLTGLSLKYYGQPFGTIEDYAGLFLWAAGTKAALDIITSIVGKFSSAP